MRISILIGYCYNNNKKEQNLYLEGIRKDILAAINFCSDKFTKIYVVSDIDEIAKYKNISEVVSEILMIEEKIEQIFFYFTGHSRNEKLIQNSDEDMTMYSILNFISGLTSSQSNVIFILDCCYSSNVFLPYYMNDEGEWKLTNCIYNQNQNKDLIKIILPKGDDILKEKILRRNTEIFSKMVDLKPDDKNILLLFPDDKQSGNSRKGSIFSQKLFLQLEKNNFNLKDLMSKTSYYSKIHNQKTQIYCSSPLFFKQNILISPLKWIQ